MIGIDLVPWLVDELAGFADDHPLFDMLIIDETSRLKDPTGKRARALSEDRRAVPDALGPDRHAAAKFVPGSVHAGRDHHRRRAVGPRLLPWRKRHFRPRDRFEREWVALPGAEERIAAAFGTVAMTVADEDMPDLPPLNVVVTRLTLPEPAMVTTARWRESCSPRSKERTIEAASPLIATGKLAQLANGFLYDDEAPRIRSASTP